MSRFVGNCAGVCSRKTFNFLTTCILLLLQCRQQLYVASMNAVHPPSHHAQPQQTSVVQQQQHGGQFGASSNNKAGGKTKHPITFAENGGGGAKGAIWNDLPFSVALEPDDRLVYSWDWNENGSDDETKVATIQVRAKINKQAWLAVGFSNNGSFHNADFCVMFGGTHSSSSSDSKRRMLLYDGWTDNEAVMHVDAQQDCRLLEAYFDAHAQRVLRFERAFDTCDDPFDYVIEDGTTHVVYALGVGPINSIEGLQLNDAQRVYGGFERITFTKPHLPTIMYPSDTKIVDITAAQVHVPQNETTYLCIIQRMPDLRTKNHIVRYEAVISAGSENLVHHIEVFHCELPAKTKVPTYQGLCHAADRPKELDHCTRVIGAWAMGAPPLEYPPNAGYPVGGDQYSSYVMIEMHYNNPQHQAGIIDSSGIRFYVSATPRPFDIGVMELGLEYTPKMSIPPETESTLLHGHCIAECTQAGLPPEGIVIFASQLHTHLTGVRVKTRHIRNGLELPLLNRDHHFNSMFQEIRRLRRPVRVLPGDELLTTCEYNTLDRPNVTLGGFGINDEMCVNYVHYYPRTNLEVCKSSVDSNALADFFDFLRVQNGDDGVDSGRNSVEENYKNVRYTPLVAGLQAQFYDQAPLSMQCNKSDGSRFAGSWNRQHQIRIDRPLSTQQRVCARPSSRRAMQNRYPVFDSREQQSFSVNDDGRKSDSTSTNWHRLSLPKLLLLQSRDNQTSHGHHRHSGYSPPNLLQHSSYADNDDKRSVIFNGRFPERNNDKNAKTQKSVLDRLFTKIISAGPAVTVKRAPIFARNDLARQPEQQDDAPPENEGNHQPQWASAQYVNGQNGLKNMLLAHAQSDGAHMFRPALDVAASGYFVDDTGNLWPNNLVNDDGQNSGEQSDEETEEDMEEEDKHVPMLHMHGQNSVDIH